MVRKASPECARSCTGNSRALTFGVINTSAAIYAGHFYRRAALTELAVEVLPNGKVLFRLESEIAPDAAIERVC